MESLRATTTSSTGAMPNRDLGATWTGVTKLKMKPEFEKTEGGNPSDAHDLFLTEDDAAAYEEEVLKGLGPERDSPEAYIAEVGSLFEHAVPDTACRKTLIGEYTLQGMQQCLRDRGQSVTWGRQENEFRFGNAGLI